MRGRSKSDSAPRSTKKDNLEQSNRNLLLQIRDLERKLQEKQKLNKKLQFKRQAKEEESMKPEEIKAQLEEQISQEKRKISENEENQKLIQENIAKIDSEIEEYKLERQNLLDKYRTFKNMSESVDSAEKKLREQQRRQSQYLENLVSLKNDISNLEGIERTTQNENMIEEIEELAEENERNKKQIDRVNKEIRSLEQRNVVFQNVYDKWKDKLDTLEEPTASLDELANAFMRPKSKQSPQKKRQYYQLQELIENNENLRITIQKERRSNVKRLKQISQVKNEMKIKTNKAIDKLQKEEQRTVKRIITLQEKNE